MPKFEFEIGSETASSSLVNGHLEEFGLAVINGFTDEDRLKRLSLIFDQLSTGQIIHECIRDKGNETVSVKVLEKKFNKRPIEVNEVFEFFNSTLLSDVASDYFKGSDYLFNENIFIAKDRPGSQHEAKDLHFDVRPTLKFFLYLSDTSSENGAFTVVPRSHKQTQELRKKHGTDISYKNRHLSRPNVPEEEQIPMEFPAGTLIIFTTELFHKAGTVTKGERRVIRSHSWRKEDDSFGVQVGQSPGLLRRILNKFTS